MKGVVFVAIYYAKEIKQIMDDEIYRMMNVLVERKSSTPDMDVACVKELRIIKQFTENIMDTLNEKEEAEKKWLEEHRASQEMEEKENGKVDPAE